MCVTTFRISRLDEMKERVTIGLHAPLQRCTMNAEIQGTPLPPPGESRGFNNHDNNNGGRGCKASTLRLKAPNNTNKSNTYMYSEIRFVVEKKEIPSG